jgi:hypothetical protein
LNVDNPLEKQDVGSSSQFDRGAIEDRIARLKPSAIKRALKLPRARVSSAAEPILRPIENGSPTYTQLRA